MSKQSEKLYEVIEDIKDEYIVSAIDDMESRKGNVNCDANSDNIVSNNETCVSTTLVNYDEIDSTVEIDFSTSDKKRSMGFLVAIAATIIVVVLAGLISRTWNKGDIPADNKDTLEPPVKTEAPFNSEDYEFEEYEEELRVGATLEPEKMNKTSIKIDKTMFDDNYIYKLKGKTNYKLDINGDGEDDIIYCDVYKQTDDYYEEEVTENSILLYINGILTFGWELSNIDETGLMYIADIDNSDGCFDLCFDDVDLNNDESENLTIFLLGRDLKSINDADFKYIEIADYLKYSNVLISDSKLNYDGIPGNTQQIHIASSALDLHCIKYISYAEDTYEYETALKRNELYEIVKDDYSIGRELNKEIIVYSEPNLESDTTTVKPQKVDFITFQKNTFLQFNQNEYEGEKQWFYIEAEDGTKGWILIVDGLYNGEEEIFTILE